jgi:hypothetical protein
MANPEGVEVHFEFLLFIYVANNGTTIRPQLRHTEGGPLGRSCIFDIYLLFFVVYFVFLCVLSDLLWSQRSPRKHKDHKVIYSEISKMFL